MPPERREFELKIELTQAALRRLRRHSALKADGAGTPKTRALRSIYFDTEDRALAGERIGLRVRRVDGAWVQTAKAGANVSAGVSNPIEDEGRVAKAEPTLDVVSDPALRQRIDSAINGKKLGPVFETRMRRTARLIRLDGLGEVELAIDVGEVVAGERAEPICEAELELKSGDPRAVFALASTLFGGEPLRLGAENKAERGHRLARGDKRAFAPVKAAASTLAPKLDAGAALGLILRACVEQIAANAPLLFESTDPEAPHQLRVGLRRLRTALRAHRALMRGKKADALARRARELFRCVGALRDADVLHDEIVPALGAAKPKKQIILLAALDAHRRDVRAETLAMMRELDIGGFLIELVETVELGDWRPKKGGKRKRLAAPAETAANAALNAAWATVAKRGRAIDTLSIDERHELRKDLKTLRYLIEFHLPLYPAKQTGPLLRRIKKLQDLFGYLNDVAMAERLRDILSGAPLVDDVVAHHEKRLKRAWRRARTLWSELAACERFW